MSDVQVDTLDHFSRVAMVARALTDRLDADEVIGILVQQGLAGLDAQGAMFGLLDGDVIVPAAVTGFTREAIHTLGTIHLGRHLPLTTAVRDAASVFLSTRAAAVEAFPELAASRSGAQAWAAIPVIADGTVLGVLGVTFAREHAFSSVERLYLQALVDIAAPSLAAKVNRPAVRPPAIDVRSIMVRAAVTSTSLTHRVSASSDGPPALAHADAEQVASIIDHLLGNAMMHTLPGTLVHLGCTAGGDRVEITVDDHGTGLSPDRRRSVFEPTAHGEGGLAQCRRLARANGGDLTCTVAPSGGARFVLTLPGALTR